MHGSRTAQPSTTTQAAAQRAGQQPIAEPAVDETAEPPLELAVSTVVFSLRPHPDTGELTLWLPLVRRIREPYYGLWALPGGPLKPDQDLVTSARDTLHATTGLAPRHLEQLYAFGDVNRSVLSPEHQSEESAEQGAEQHGTPHQRPGYNRAGPGQTHQNLASNDPSGDVAHHHRSQLQSPRVVSIVYWALVRQDEDAAAVVGDNVEWFPADDTAEEAGPLAFDHDVVLDYALRRLRAKVTYSPIAHAFLPEKFPLAELRRVYEAILSRALDPSNFRRQILAQGSVEDTGERMTGTAHRPPKLYRSNPNRSPYTLTIEETS